MRPHVAIQTVAYLSAALALRAVLSGPPALAADRPDWAFPPKQTEQAAAVSGASSDLNAPLHVPGSNRTYTRAQIDVRMDARGLGVERGEDLADALRASGLLDERLGSPLQRRITGAVLVLDDHLETASGAEAAHKRAQ